MELRPLGRSGLNVSAICLGTMTWGQQNTEADGHAQMDFALDHGVNFFDTAELYAVPPKAETQGRTETIIGNWFKARGRREHVILASKVVGRTANEWFRGGRPSRLVRADIMDAIDYSLRLNTEVNEPFGGKTMVLVGDLWQLEPVVGGNAEQEMISHRYASPFFFDSQAVRDTSLDVIELQTVHRQKDDPEFLWALNKLRKGETDEIEYFNERVGTVLEGENIITLTATNARANAINLAALNKLPTTSRTYKGTAEGNFGNEFPADPILTLKVGAQVMFVKNAKHWVNGMLGTVVSLDEDVISVRTDRGEIVAVERETWEKNRFTWDRHQFRIQAEAVGSYLQFPLRLAWAVTIHKSQGLTFDNLILDLDRRAFAHGQLYVALSRCRTLAGLSLRNAIVAQDSIVHPRVWEFEKLAGLVPS